jgi:hypothetical protein
MTRFLELLISMAIVAVLFVIVGVLLPSSRHLSESVETNRRQAIVFDTLNSFRRFDDWNPLVLRDPGVQLRTSGPDEGVGARLEYTSTNSNIGEGSWEIVESEPDSRVVYAFDDNVQRGRNMRYAFTLEPTGRNNRNVEITQTFDVDYGWDLLGRYAGLYVSRNIGDNIKLGLGRLGNMLASVPNVDYRVEGVPLTGLAVSELPAENLLVVKAGAIERNNEVIRKAMQDNAEWIKRTIAANGLEAVGPLRIITTELGRDTYTFDVAQGVRRKGGGDAAAGDEAAEGDDTADTATAAAEGEGEGDAAPTAAVDTAPAPAAAGPELGELELLGPVEYVRTEPSRIARGHYTGYMAELENVRNAVRAWAMTRGEEIAGRPYEVYRNGVDEAFTADGRFDVVWVLKR